MHLLCVQCFLLTEFKDSNVALRWAGEGGCTEKEFRDKDTGLQELRRGAKARMKDLNGEVHG
jgi:hypothetical protein